MDGNWDIAPQNPWRTPAIVGVLGIAIVGLSIQFADRAVSTYSYAHIHHPEWAKLLTKLAYVPDPVALAMLALVGVMYLRQRTLSPAMRTAIAACLATLLATVAVIVLKIAFGRLWPETWVTPPNPSWINTHQYGFEPFHGGKGYESFPSGHTTRITAPFAVLWARLPRYRVLWVLPTIVVMVGLLASDFHFLGDCLAGILLAMASAAVVLAVM